LFSGFFTKAHHKSIFSMIETWKKDSQWRSVDMESILNAVRDRDALGDDEISVSMDPNNAQSVAWAKKTLYQKDGDFEQSWKSELQALLRAPAYVTLQIEAALFYHRTAISYLQRIGIWDLRSYLLMFDIVTQNGGISENRFQEWEEYVATHQLSDVVSKLKALVDIRLQDTNPRWRQDTKIRKYAIIDGGGVVHNINRDFQRTYCYKSTDPVE